MQTQNYVYYMHFFVSKESEQKCARALFGTVVKQISAKKVTSKGLNVHARAQ